MDSADCEAPPPSVSPMPPSRSSCLYYCTRKSRRPDQGMFLCAMTLICLPSLFFAIFVAPYVLLHYSAWTLVVFVWLWAMGVATLLKALPKYPPPPMPEPQDVVSQETRVSPQTPSEGGTLAEAIESRQPAHNALPLISFAEQPSPRPPSSSTSGTASPPSKVSPVQGGPSKSLDGPHPEHSGNGLQGPGLQGPGQGAMGAGQDTTTDSSQYPFLPTTYTVYTCEIMINGQPYHMKWCSTCNLWRPPRASHCSTCDACIMVHDHHCPWIANCVGKHNYRYFYAFVVTNALLALFVFSNSLAQLLELSEVSGETFFTAMSQAPVSMILVVYTFLIFWSLAGLVGYHTWLSFKNQTTHEQVRWDGRQGGRSPFDRGGWCRNWLWVLCRPLEVWPSKLKQ